MARDSEALARPDTQTQSWTRTWTLDGSSVLSLLTRAAGAAHAVTESASGNDPSESVNDPSEILNCHSKKVFRCAATNSETSTCASVQARPLEASE